VPHFSCSAVEEKLLKHLPNSETPKKKLKEKIGRRYNESFFFVHYASIFYMMFVKIHGGDFIKWDGRGDLRRLMIIPYDSSCALHIKAEKTRNKHFFIPPPITSYESHFQSPVPTHANSIKFFSPRFDFLIKEEKNFFA
jgi:hypothetical protein